MEYNKTVFCTDRGAHFLTIDDGVIVNWFAAMWDNDCPAMLFALPQMQSAILEWRANWLGDTPLLQVEDGFQAIHDSWLSKLTGNDSWLDEVTYGQVNSTDINKPNRLPGDWLAFYRLSPAPSHQLLRTILNTPEGG